MPTLSLFKGFKMVTYRYVMWTVSGEERSPWFEDLSEARGTLRERLRTIPNTVQVLYRLEFRVEADLEAGSTLGTGEDLPYGEDSLSGDVE